MPQPQYLDSVDDVFGTGLAVPDRVIDAVLGGTSVDVSPVGQSGGCRSILNGFSGNHCFY